MLQNRKYTACGHHHKRIQLELLQRDFDADIIGLFPFGIAGCFLQRLLRIDLLLLSPGCRGSKKSGRAPPAASGGSFGRVAERLMAPVSKSGDRKVRGFESRPVRHTWASVNGKPAVSKTATLGSNPSAHARGWMHPCLFHEIAAHRTVNRGIPLPPWRGVQAVSGIGPLLPGPERGPGDPARRARHLTINRVFLRGGDIL